MTTSAGPVAAPRPLQSLAKRHGKLFWYGLGAVVLLVGAGLTVAGIAVDRFLIHDAHFRIPDAPAIETSGLTEVSRSEVLPVFGEDIGRNIFFVSLRQRREQLEEIPWVKQATVMRLLPARLSVQVVERTPVAFVRVGQQVELADAEGVILKMPPEMMAGHHYSFPVVTGIQPQDALSVRKARMAQYMRFVAELDQNHQHLSDQVSEVDVTDPEDLRAVMPEKGADVLAHFGEADFLSRWQVYQAHIGEWRQRYPKLVGVDLRYQGEVPLVMSNDSGAGGNVPTPTGSASAPASPAVQPKPVAGAVATAVQPQASAGKALAGAVTKAGGNADGKTVAKPGKTVPAAKKAVVKKKPAKKGKPAVKTAKAEQAAKAKKAAAAKKNALAHAGVKLSPAHSSEIQGQ